MKGLLSVGLIVVRKCDTHIYPAIAAVLIAPLLLASLVWSADSQKIELVGNPRVLILHSYHVGFTWSDNITRGIQTIFRLEAPQVELLFEYMDEKRRSDAAYFQSLHRFLREKYEGQKIDAVIVSDDRALDFLLGEGGDLFPGAPAVFCGINGYDPEKHRGNDRALTGIVESIDIEATLDVALELHPKTRTVAYITDASLPGKALKRAAETAFSSYRDRLQFTYLEHKNMAQLQEEVARLDQGAIVFAFIFNRDELGRIWSHEYNLERMASRCSVPIYSVWEFYLGHGIVGGMLTSGIAHGEEAANMVLRILRGEPASQIPVRMQSPNRFMFDYSQLKRFGVKTLALPPGSILINEPISVYQAHKDVVWTTVAFVLALLIIIAFLTRDVRLRRRAEGELQKSESKFRSVYETAPLAFVIWDTRCRVVGWNDQAEKMFGYQRDEAVRKNFFNLIVPDDAEQAVRKIVDDLLDGKIERHVINQNVTKNGDMIWCEWNNSILRDTNGQIVAAISLGLDITERIAAENELAKYRHHLEELVEERTSALEAKNKELEMFTYSVSHDLKAPLRGIDGYSRLLIDEYGEKLDGEAKQFLHNVRNSTEQMNQLIEDLLTYSRAERRDILLDSIDLPSMIDFLVKEREHDLANRKIQLKRDLPFQNLVSDRDSLRQILGNLLDNAIKFTRDESSAFIEIAGRETETHWILQVRDNGVGFDPKYQERIFGIFQRLHRIEEYPGTGVGLAIVQKAVNRLGGRIRAEGKLGEGASFHVELPKSNKSF